ncbi:ABC transporter substrate-binding protein [Sphingorhabdus arenilitoris]|uniref:ABC transporter substrate-binding protein n=1 Tax=Sphingorhabdus arenilitoris TaxID=1490041 RepID=A0ABV8RIV9_9SPHN
MRFLLLTFLLILTGCSNDGPKGSGLPADTLVRLTESEARGLDPQMVSDLSSIRIASDQFEGLTRYMATGQVEPALAQGWTVSADGLEWTFQLKPDLRFSDGTPVEAEIFTKALARINDPATGSPHAALFAIIKTVESPDRRRVIIRLNSPFPQLPALLAHPAMAALPFHLIGPMGEKWTSMRPLVTSGAYRMTDWKLNQRMEMEANPHWTGGQPKTPKLIWKSMDNPLSSMRLMLSGGAHISTAYPANRQAWLTKHYSQMVHGSDYLATYYFAFNTRRPPFNNANVRRALAMATDRRWMTDKMIAAGNAPAWGLLPPGLSGDTAFRPVWANWTKERRLAQARRLLASAGYGAANPLRFEIRFNSSPEHRRAAAAMATMWRPLGVEASLLNSEASLHFDSLKRGDFELARSGWVADLPAPENFLLVHRSDTGPQNYSGYASARFDTALDKALAEADPNRRASKMRAAEEILIGDMPILPLYFYVSTALVHPKISGWHDNIANVHPSYNLAIAK